MVCPKLGENVSATKACSLNSTPGMNLSFIDLFENFLLLHLDTLLSIEQSWFAKKKYYRVL